MGALLAAHAVGVPNIYQMGYLTSSLLCVGGISGLSGQKTARIGNAMGIIGVIGGVVTALAQLNLPAPVFAQAIGLLTAASAVGLTLGYKV
jgi:NAD(P) transhydrogenase